MQKIFITVIIFFSVYNLHSQVPPPESFFSCAEGNVWEYWTEYGSEVYRIIKDSTDDEGGHYLYYAPPWGSPYSPFYKVEDFKVYFLDGLNWLNFKLDADSGEIWTVHPEDNYQRIEAKVNYIQPGYIGDKPAYLMSIDYWRLPFGDTTISGNSFYDRGIELVSGIGIYAEYNDEAYPVKILRGAIIDGDTIGTITSVDVNNSINSDEFTLLQNYPNPFNPITKIEYNLITAGNVTLKVFNILGEEVRTLLNEYQISGSYTIEFNAEGLPSGNYYYTLTAENKDGKQHQVTKHMTLIK